MSNSGETCAAGVPSTRLTSFDKATHKELHRIAGGGAGGGREEEEEGPAYACYAAVAIALGTETRGTLCDSPSQVNWYAPPQQCPLGWGATTVPSVMVCGPLTTIGYPRI